jgi:fumarate reductase flavoprotein subunit
VECPVGAISFKHSKYWIDPEKCISCGKCVKFCHNGCISDPQHPAPKAPAHEKVVETCDVCVIGAGGAGQVAALKALDEGCSVVLLEKMHEVGGSAWYAGGFRTHWSNRHPSLGLEDHRKELYEEFLERVNHNVDEKLLKRYFEANTDFANWLLDEHHIEDRCEVKLGHMGPGAPVVVFEAKEEWKYASHRIDRMIGPGEIGSELAEHLDGEFSAKGGKLLLKTAAKKLLTDETGAVVGVLAEDEGGQVEIRCKAVVVAAGAFSRNKELMNKFQPLFYDDEGKEKIHVFTGAGCTGDGITMCDELGADIDYVNRRVNMFGPMRHPFPCASLALYMNRDGFEIGSQGNVMHQEGGPDEVSPLVKDPKYHGWKIIDNRIAETNIAEALEEPPQSKGMDLPKFQRNWRAVIAQEAEDNAIVMADTLEELAQKLGIDVAQFLENVKEHNKTTEIPPVYPPDMPDFMLPKHDPMPIAEGPFYAIKMKMFHEDAIGGMTIDENASVLKNGTPIPGLYAAGDTTRGIIIPGAVGVDYIESVFSALTMAYDEGYIAGTEAAKFSKAK